MERKTILITIIFFAIGVVVVDILFFTPHYSYFTRVAGVEVKSDTPFSEVYGWRNIKLVDSDDGDILICNFELSAISLPDRNGHLIKIKKSNYGNTGIYIHRGSVTIEGDSSYNLLNACHAFACLRDNITCPDDLSLIRKKILDLKRINVILDSNIGVDGVSGYGDTLAALGYIQAKTAKPHDLNNDGLITKNEIEDSIVQNMLLIFPYMMYGNKCKAQPFNSALQRINTTNETFNCSELTPSIRFIKSDRNRISIDGDNIIIEGDDIHIHTGAIIVRDIIAPEFILNLYGLK